MTRRESLISLLREAQRQDEKQFDEDNGVTKEKFVMLVAKDKGATKLLNEINVIDAEISLLHSKKNDIDEELQAVGFQRSGGGLREHYDAPQALTKSIADRYAAARRPIEKIKRKYDLAISRIWTAVSPEEMSKVMESAIGQ